MTITVVENSAVRIQVKVRSASDSWSFLNAYAGALGLGDRIKRFEASGSSNAVSVKQLTAGEFRLDRAADTLDYVVQIQPGRPGELAHISWLTKDNGLLMLADLLPESLLKEDEIVVEFELPDQLNVESAYAREAANRFVVTTPDKALFIVGQRLDVQTRDAAKVVVNNKWKFTGKDILKTATMVLEEYRSLTGSSLPKSTTILITALPLTDSNATWKAETRGSTVVLLLNPQAQIKNWVGQIGIILTHELFHLWVPNSLAFNGDYDWFFEGFTLYVALQTALKLNMISFQEYLDTLARVYDSYLSYSDDQSLIEASERRWTSSVPLVYDKGMLAAFLYDLTLRSQTGGQSRLLDKYRLLFGGAVQQPDANDVIIRTLTSSPETEDLVKSYILGRKRLELEKTLPAFGFQLSVDGPKSRLSVRKDLNDPQKHLLRSLGYRK